ncbi:ABC-2 type transporter-domain-containing protein [Pholiota molesta]|nr:ABC-2 type transporter-domain-containing protein [Pholiota molesta]
MFANLTASNCSCEDGWTGTGCNVCQTASACQSAFAAVGSVSASTASSVNSQGNNTMVCNREARVWASSQMSCRVEVQSYSSSDLSPLFNLNIMRNFQPALSPIPNATSFGAANTTIVQLFYDGVEQFFCEADSCTQDLGTTNDGSANWACSNLRCTCRPGTTFCGGVSASNLTSTIDTLGGTLGINCAAVDPSTDSATCNFVQGTLQELFGSAGLALNGCTFGECVRQNVIDGGGGNTSSTSNTSKSLGGGVIAGLAVIGALLLLALFQRSRAFVEWSDLSYKLKASSPFFGVSKSNRQDGNINNDKFILDNVSGKVMPGQMMAILGPSDNTTNSPRVGFVPQQDILPATLTVFETLLFAARLRLPENVTDREKKERVNILLEKLGIFEIKDVRIGDVTGGKARGISGGEMRRVSIGLELIASPDVLLLDEPTSGLDSVSAARVADVLYAIAHDKSNPIPVIASIHQPSSQLYQKFDSVLLLSHGRLSTQDLGICSCGLLYHGGFRIVPPYQQGYNVAEYLLEVASDPPVLGTSGQQDGAVTTAVGRLRNNILDPTSYLCGREWKILKRDKTLFLTHVLVSPYLECGLYFHTGITIAGFQSRVGCLFFLGSLIAFSSLSALYNMVEIRPLFLRERSSSYYSPVTWLLSRFFFDMIPLRLIPTIIVSTITYWMAGLAPDAVNFFKFLLILVLYSLCMTLFNFLLGTLFQNGGIAILLSALSALYQMTFAGFFVHLNDIPQVLRWLQWICPLKYALEALSVNEVGSGLMIQDTLQGVPVNISASLIMNLLFGFGDNNYYRDVLVLVAFILGFGFGVITIVWFKVRERR